MKHTGLVNVTVYEGKQPTCFQWRAIFVPDKRGSHKMVVPSKAVVEHASRGDRLRQVVLQGRSKVIGITSGRVVRSGLVHRHKFNVPEVEIL